MKRVSRRGRLLEMTRCLRKAVPSKQKGGTVVAEQIVDEEAHARALENPDLVRPAECPHCHRSRPQVHDRRPRVLRGTHGTRKVIQILRFRCGACRAVIRVLPAFVCRFLHRTWATVAAALRDAEKGSQRAGQPLSHTTVSRWRARFNARDQVLTVLLGASFFPPLVRMAEKLGLHATRRDIAVAFGPTRLHHLDALVHRIQPGFRLA